jgi:hypothetical protein
VSATLLGGAELHKRLKALASVPAASGNAGFGRLWQNATVRAARPMIPVRTGATRASIRPGLNRKGTVTVVGKYTVNFIDAGSKAHVEPRQFSKFTPTGRISKRKRGSGKVLKFQVGGQTMFRRKVNKPKIAAHPFKKAAGRKGLDAANWSEFIIGLWNKAA